MRCDEDEHLVMLESLGALYTRGYPVDWPRAQGSDGLATRLPLYPWQWERCWLDVVPQAISRAIAPVDLPPVAEPVPAAEGPGQTLRGLDPERRRIRLDALLREQLAAVLGGDPDRIDPTRPLPELGLQSMMAVELRNRLEGLLDLKLSATLVWSYPTLEAISGHLADRLGTPSTPSVSLAPSDAVRALEAELDSLGAVVTPPLAGNAEELLLAELEALEKGTTR